MNATSEWLENSPLPSLPTEAEQIAEKLILIIHYGVDFSIWGGVRRVRYWDALAERVKASTYAGPTLNEWHSNISSSLVSQPRNEKERLELVELLQSDNEREILKTLRNKAQTLVLRVRVISELRKEKFKEEGKTYE